MRRGKELGIFKMLVTICMNVCNMLTKEACAFEHLYGSLPQGNWFEKFQEYTPLIYTPNNNEAMSSSMT